MMTTGEKIQRLAHAASLGAEQGPGYFPGADRVAAARVYARVVAFPERTGSGPNAQRRQICRRFAELAELAGVSPRQVKDYLRSTGTVDSTGRPTYGLYGL